MADEYRERQIMRFKERYQGTDWAFTRGTPTDRQMSLITYIIDKNPEGTMGIHSCGIDYGGHNAYWSIVNGLIRQGYATIKDKTIILLKGEPVPVQSLTLPKPYIKIKKALVATYCDDAVMDMDTTIWLDPRGDGEFIIAMAQEMEAAFHNDKRVVRLPEGYLAAKAPTFKDVITHAESIAKEYHAITCGSIVDVLVVSHECSFAEPGKAEKYNNKSGLAFSMTKAIMINGKGLWQRTTNGKLYRITSYKHQYGTPEQRAEVFERERGVIMNYTPEREAALTAMKTRLENMASEFIRIIREEDFATMIETHGHMLIGHNQPQPDDQTT